MPSYTLELEGKTATVESETPLSDKDLSWIAGQKFGAAVPKGEGDKAKTPTTAEGIQGSIFGAGQPKELDAIQQIGNAVLPPLVAAAPTMGAVGTGGALASKALPQIPRLAAAGGRIATSGALGAGEAALKGDDPLGAGLRDTGMAAVWEGILGAVPYLPKGGLAKTAGKLAEREGAFKSATEAPMKAYEKLKAYVPAHAWMEIPSISDKPITFKAAVDGLAKLKGADYAAARAEIGEALKHPPLGGPVFNPPVKASIGLQQQGIRPKGGQVSEGFLKRTSDARFDPPSTGLERFAKKTVGTLRDPAVRAGVDVLAGEGPDEMPLGLLPLAAGESGLKAVARRILR